MGDLSDNFSRSEFACKCGCGFDTVDVELIRLLEHVRAHFDRPVYITSACRCNSHNAASGGSISSLHLVGRAADIRIDGVDARLVAELADQLGAGGVGTYQEFTHIDTRTNGPARWSG